MYAAPFTYRIAHSHQEVVQLLERYGEDAKILAGGQSLVPMMQLRLVTPTCLIDTNEIPVPPTREERGVLAVPAGVRHAQLLQDPLITRHVPMVTEAARHIGNVRVRSRGTVGGSLVHADPSAELPCVMTALGAQMVLISPDGVRVVDADAFFLGFFTSAAQAGDVLTEVRIPIPGQRTGHAFVEYSRRASDFAVVEVAALAEVDRRGRCARASLVYGGVAGNPVRVDGHVETILSGGAPTTEAIARAVEAAVQELDPPSDVHGSAESRRHLARTLGTDALARAFERARS